VRGVRDRRLVLAKGLPPNLASGALALPRLGVFEEYLMKRAQNGLLGAAGVP